MIAGVAKRSRRSCGLGITKALVLGGGRTTKGIVRGDERPGARVAEVALLSAANVEHQFGWAADLCERLAPSRASLELNSSSAGSIVPALALAFIHGLEGVEVLAESEQLGPILIGIDEHSRTRPGVVQVSRTRVENFGSSVVITTRSLFIGPAAH